MSLPHSKSKPLHIRLAKTILSMKKRRQKRKCDVMIQYATRLGR